MSLNLKEVADADLKKKLDTLLARIEFLMLEIGPKLKECGELREEGQYYYMEMDKRGLLEKNYDVDPTLKTK